MSAPDRIPVLHVMEAMHQGGAESLVLEHVALASPGFEPLVCAINRGGPALDAVAALGAEAFVLRRPGERGLGERLAAVRRLAGFMRRRGVRVVNGHNPTGALTAVAAARLAGVPVVVRTEHSLHYPGRHSAFYPPLEHAATFLTQRVVCVCEAVRESHVRRLPWAARRFVTVANGISPAPHTRVREEVRREIGVDPGAPLALTVGSLTPQKAQGTLLEAFARVAAERPDARLAVAGEGPLGAALEARRQALGLARAVTFLGPRLDVADLLAASDAFVLSSVREGLSVTLLEAMRAGRPVVATRVGGNPEAVAEGASGLLVPAGDAAALGDALLRLLRDPGLARAMGEAGRERWRERFTARRMVDETEALYREALARAGGRDAAGADEGRRATDGPGRGLREGTR